MKRLIALLAVGAAVAAVLAVPSGAVDTKGPPCANIVFGDGGYTLLTSPPSLRSDSTSLRRVAPPSPTRSKSTTCRARRLATDISGVSGATSLSFTQRSTGVRRPAGVCLVGTTSLGRHVADRAPDRAAPHFPRTTAASASSKDQASERASARSVSARSPSPFCSRASAASSSDSASHRVIPISPKSFAASSA